MSKMATLDHVRAIAESAVTELLNAEGDVKVPERLVTAAMPGPEWKVLVESKDPSEVISAYGVYSQKTGPCDRFVSSLSSAARLYLQSIGDKDTNYELTGLEFMVINRDLLEGIPYLSEHLKTAAEYAELRLKYEPADKMFRLASSVAFIKRLDDKTSVNSYIRKLFKEGYIEGLLEYFESNDRELPAIAKDVDLSHPSD